MSNINWFQQLVNNSNRETQTPEFNRSKTHFQIQPFLRLSYSGTVGVMVIIRDSHSRDPGSIPGRCTIFTHFFFFFFHFFRSKSHHVCDVGCDVPILILLPKKIKQWFIRFQTKFVDGFQKTWHQIFFLSCCRCWGQLSCPQSISLHNTYQCSGTLILKFSI